MNRSQNITYIDIYIYIYIYQVHFFFVKKIYLSVILPYKPVWNVGHNQTTYNCRIVQALSRNKKARVLGSAQNQMSKIFAYDIEGIFIVDSLRCKAYHIVF